MTLSRVAEVAAGEVAQAFTEAERELEDFTAAAPEQFMRDVSTAHVAPTQDARARSILSQVGQAALATP